eukprot:42908-Chlamydomonas_euryale.AAC.1
MTHALLSCLYCLPRSFVSKLRTDCWEHGRPLPRMPRASRRAPSASPAASCTPVVVAIGVDRAPGDEPPPPDPSCCLLHQKLQMLQLCIHRRKAAAAAAASAARAGGVALRAVGSGGRGSGEWGSGGGGPSAGSGPDSDAPAAAFYSASEDEQWGGTSPRGAARPLAAAGAHLPRTCVQFAGTSLTRVYG